MTPVTPSLWNSAHILNPSGTTGGKLGNYLMGALPNATYMGFTGTPIDKTSYGKGTFLTFGQDDPPKGYLDKYSIAESIEDKTTVKLHYNLAPNELQVEQGVLEKEFLNMADAEGISDVDQLNKVLEKAVNLRNMLKNKERTAKIIKHIADHYQNTVEPLGYKAFIVAVDREACIIKKNWTNICLLNIQRLFTARVLMTRSIYGTIISQTMKRSKSERNFGILMNYLKYLLSQKNC
ncbi:MAG: hypothetical protein R6U98_04505 [Pirellulaceae bacterium]